MAQGRKKLSKKSVEVAETSSARVNPAMDGLVRVRVKAEKYAEVPNRRGGSKISVVPWLGNNVFRKGVTYGPGDEFEVSENESVSLLSSGSIEKANEKPTPFRPPSLDHAMFSTNGVVLKSETLGKVPTRVGSGDYGADWEEYEDA